MSEENSIEVEQAPAPAPVQEKSQWTDGFSEDMVGLVQNKGWSSPSDVVSSYQNAEKLIGVPEERVLKIPEKPDDCEAWDKVYSKLGRPEDSKDYSLEIPEGGLNDPMADWARTSFHKAGLTDRQANLLSKDWNEHMKGVASTNQEDLAAKAQEQDKALKKEWGAAYDSNVKIAQKASREFSLDADSIDRIENALGYSEVMKLMHNVGAKLGEDTFATGDTSANVFGAMTPAQANHALADLMLDKEFMEAWMDNQHPGHKEAVARKSRLTGWAYPEVVNG